VGMSPRTLEYCRSTGQGVLQAGRAGSLFLLAGPSPAALAPVSLALTVISLYAGRMSRTSSNVATSEETQTIVNMAGSEIEAASGGGSGQGSQDHGRDVLMRL